MEFQSLSARDEQHGLIEDRDYAVSGDVAWLADRHPDWKTIRSIGVAESAGRRRGRSRRNGGIL
jgi:hypothetical protein